MMRRTTYPHPHTPSALSTLAFPFRRIRLSLGAPDVLEEAVALGQAVEGVVALAHGADEAAEGVGLVLALDGTAVLVDLGDGDLDGAVVLGLDDAVGRRALPRDVATRRKKFLSVKDEK